VTDGTGALISQQRYLPFGQVRTDLGSITQTDFGYTSQRKLDDGMGGIMDYKARFYSPYITQFSQPDSIVPNAYNPQSLNRYSYANNNPLRYTDPSGHRPDDGCLTLCRSRSQKQRESQKAKQQVKNGPSSYVCPVCLPKPDATVISFSYSAGIGPLYRRWGLDIVITDNEVGFFTVNGSGPWPESERNPVSLPQKKMDTAFTFPSIGGGVSIGGVYGVSLRETVKNYQGPSLVEGGSLVVAGVEWFETVNPETGVPDGNLAGWTIGIGSPDLPEAHRMFLDAAWVRFPP
jgi:RHS repeat-associated protein